MAILCKLQTRPITPSSPIPTRDTTQVWYPLLRFREEGMTTFTIGPEAGKVYQSKKGYPCKADRDIDSVSTQVFELSHFMQLLHLRATSA